MEFLTTNTCQQIVAAMADTVHQKRDELSALDAVLGDGDHGFNMDTALQAVVQQIGEMAFEFPADIFEQVGTILMNKMGGASGIIFGSFFSGGSRAVREKEVLTLADVVLFFAKGIEKVEKRGKAKVGDKTLLDALMPAFSTLQTAHTQHTPLPEAMHQAAQAAQAGAEKTKTFVAQHGRAKFLGERSLGHQDAGATSMALMLNAWAEAMSPV
jgi:dihydroxyacetone kinase-like protein